ncbi:M56/M15 family metallopeptidase [Winogradskyella sp. SYSU M77433]|uniref:M56/M15 family metallopeptidase n=1 Tax=Winogradskyella sp. SYSU M77433 TaxID=3042722 RepID=UPI0024812E5E|nr:M56/M15 family metallopeptidase [Winogradskyella sp. SYSU M77433]MDH7914138.1 M56/M15 family metallopeptidase [Winogradskyella sp. SYSU M77433]
MGSIFLCLLSPFIEFEIFSSVPSITQIPVENFSELQVNNDFEDVVVGNTTAQQKSEVSFWTYAYVLFFVLFLSRFLKNLFSIFYLTKGNFKSIGKLRIIKVKDSDMVSSFFNYVFVPENHAIKDEDFSSVMAHELIHSKEFHTVDVIILEFLTCIFWVNPFVWLYKKDILQNHEYIADEKSILSGIDIESYSKSIINLGQKEYCVPLTSGFNFIQIKNRIIMLHQLKSSVLKRVVKISTSILLVTGILIFSSYKDLKETLVVVVDAGHGGLDEGSGSITDIKEKDVLLDISNKLASLSNEKVKIIVTRNSDDFLSLSERADMINKVKPHFMISLHNNFSTNEAINGIEAYYYDKNENAEKSDKYSRILLDNQQEMFYKNRGIRTANFQLLKKINCPATFLELGFLSNKKDVQILASNQKRSEIADAIFKSLNQIRENR